MVRVSNKLVGLLNLVTFLLSIPILGGGIWLANRASTDCERYLEKPMIAIGVFLMLVSLASLIGACCRVSWLLWAHLLVMLLLIVIIFCFTIFAIVVTSEGAGDNEAVSGEAGYEENRLEEDYSDWLRNGKRVESTKNWNKIKSCIIDSKICTKFNQKYLDDYSVCDNIRSSSLETARQSFEFASLAVDFSSKLTLAHQTIDRLKEEAAQGEERCQLKEEPAKLNMKIAELKAALKETEEKLASSEHSLLLATSSVESQKAEIKEL